ncbi:efflux RND transporter periplasmic adaptor subunit [Arenicellales bacterium IMCC55707]
MDFIRRILLMTALFGFSVPLFAENVEAEVDWNRRVAMGFGISGHVKSVKLKVGSRVSMNEPLVTLDSSLLDIAHSRSVNAVQIREIEVDEYRAVMEREQTLFDEGSLSAVSLDQTALELSRRELALSNAELELEQTSYMLELASLRAPFDAWVVDSDFTVGQYVYHESEEPPVITLAERGRYLARAVVDVPTLSAIESAKELKIIVGDNVYVAVGVRLGIEPVSGSIGNSEYSVAFEFASDELIRPGTSCSISVF